MNIKMQEVHGFNHPEMPLPDETIADSLDIDILIPLIHSCSYYLRSPEDCPLARGNWLLDIECKNGGIYCFKFPKEMTRERFIAFLQPLLIRLNQG